MVAIGGIGFAGVVYFALGEREKRVPPPPPARMDPTAVIESSGAVLRQTRGVKQDFEVKAQRQLTYADGVSKGLNVEITVRGRGGRDFVMTGDEARGGEKDSTVEVSGHVKVNTSDGFEVTTDRASFTGADGVVRAPGPFVFHRGGMSGSGVGMTYDKNTDVLTIVDQARVVVASESGRTSTDFSSGGATLLRRDHVLVVERSVHALHGEQVIETDRATARLTENEEGVTYLELRGNARVVGGSTAFDSMSANDIDLDYTDDGKTLERVILKGKGAVAMAGEGSPGRQFFGDSLTVAVAPDGTVSSVVGRQNVRLDLLATKTSPRRTVRAGGIDATGEPAHGLTAARFSDGVEFQEESAHAGAGLVVRARTLRVSLAQDAISSTTFAGSVTFDQQGLSAGAAEAQYDPGAGLLRLKGADQGGGPRVADQQVSITADAIDVTLEGHSMAARGNVKTTLQAQRDQSRARLPGLLEDAQSANINADSLQYDGPAGRVVYTGRVQLWQADTAIRSNELIIDRATADLLARGDARSTIVMDKSSLVGRAAEIRYTDATREIDYRSTPGPEGPEGPEGPTGPGAAGGPRASTRSRPAAAAAAPAHLSGPQGELFGDRIVVALQTAGSHVDRLEVYGHVTLKLDTRRATGARLTYYAGDERYAISGVSGSPVKVEERCSETTGQTLTFFRSTDRIIVDGNEESRTQTKGGGGTCPEPRLP